MKNLASKIQSSLPKHLVRLLKLAGKFGDELGFKVYAVGGFVRDLLLGVENLDVDLTVEGDGITYATRFAQKQCAKVVKHPRFGTATVYFRDGYHIDVVTSRKESYPHPAALPEVVEGLIRRDLQRRDFTINGLAVRLNPAGFGELVDIFNGEHDLRKGVIRVMHNLSFQDDPTRIFRAVRFSRRYRFRIEPLTRRLMRQAIDKQMCDRLSGRRIRNEIYLLLNEVDPPAVIRTMARFGVLECINRRLEFNAEKSRLLGRIENVLPSFRKTVDWFAYFLGLVYGLKGRELDEISERLMLSRKESEKVILVGEVKSICKRLNSIKSYTPAHVYRMLKGLPEELLVLIIAVANTGKVRRVVNKYFSEWRKVKIKLSGDDLLKLGLKPGPRFGKILEEVLYAKLNGRLKTKRDEVAYVVDNFLKQ